MCFQMWRTSVEILLANSYVFLKLVAVRGQAAVPSTTNTGSQHSPGGDAGGHLVGVAVLSCLRWQSPTAPGAPALTDSHHRDTQLHPI